MQNYPVKALCNFFINVEGKMFYGIPGTGYLCNW